MTVFVKEPHDALQRHLAGNMLSQLLNQYASSDVIAAYGTQWTANTCCCRQDCLCDIFSLLIDRLAKDTVLFASHGNYRQCTAAVVVQSIAILCIQRDTCKQDWPLVHRELQCSRWLCL